MKVFKYVLGFALPVEGEDGEKVFEVAETELEIPAGSQILSVELTIAGPALFVLVDEDAPLEERTFAVVDNGVELPEGVTALNYRGSCKIPGALTFHVFETTSTTVPW